MRHAGIVSRLSIVVIDVTVLTVACTAVSVLPALAAEQIVGTAPGWLVATTSTIASLLPLLYFAGAWWLSGQTLGNLLMGFTVRRHGGGPVGAWRALLRAVVGLLFFPIWLIGLVVVLFDRDRRALHDRIFGTEVVST